MLKKIFNSLGRGDGERIYICKGKRLPNGEYTGIGFEVTGI